MVRQLKRRTVSRKSLTALRWINPKSWNLSKQKISDALQIPLERVKNATCRQHQVCISWYNEAGVVCWSFFGVAHVWYDRDVVPIQLEYDLSRMPVYQD